ncbi:hypothetical protein [Streptomyces sp. NPDC004286]
MPARPRPPLLLSGCAQRAASDEGCSFVLARAESLSKSAAAVAS